MKKMRNRRGFTLIEMMVVIAVVAILVSVIIPVVNGNTDKAAAATNAANLRSVEGEVIAMMLVSPDAFGDKSAEQAAIDATKAAVGTTKENLATAQQNLETAEQNLQAAEERLATAEQNLEDFETTKENELAKIAEYQNEINDLNARATASTNTNHDGCTQGIFTYKNHAPDCKDYLLGQVALAQKLLNGYSSVVTDKETYETAVTVAQAAVEAAEEAKNIAQNAVNSANQFIEENEPGLAQAEYDLYVFTADENGVIHLEDGVTLEAPPSKAVSIGAVDCAKDVPMVIYVNPTTYEAFAYYGDYHAADFAAVANKDVAEAQGE